MPGKKTSVNRQKLENSLSLAWKPVLKDSRSSRETALLPGMLNARNPFFPRRESDPQCSESEVFQKAITEGTASLLYPRMEEEADSELPSGWLFLRLQQSYYQNLVQKFYWSECELFLKDFPILTTID